MEDQASADASGGGGSNAPARPPTTPAGEQEDTQAPAHPFALSTFSCPVCLDLMYKPCVASPCAHCLCFWCHHRAMDAFSASACPLCRQAFRHQAGVCAPLHRFLAAAFPAEFAAREAEVKAEEGEHGVASMDVEPADDDGAGQDGGPLSPSAWRCAAPACGRLLARPTALLCGHVVCAACVPPSSRPACQKCGRPGRAAGAGPPRPCPLLAEVVGGLFPGAYAARLAEDGGGVGGEGAAPSSPAGEGGGGPGGPPATAAAAAAPPRPRPLPPARPFTHFGVGCDACGAYPITGRRYQCADCPEAIGFDVCGDCFDGGAVGGTGRFAQAHTADHTLREVVPVRTGLHVLQDLNPDLSVDAILRLRALAVEDEEGGGGGGGARPPVPPDPVAASSILIEEEAGAGGGAAPPPAPGDVAVELDHAALPPDFPFQGVDEFLAFFSRVEDRAAAGQPPSPEDEDILRRFFPHLWAAGELPEGWGSEDEGGGGG